MLRVLRLKKRSSGYRSIDTIMLQSFNLNKSHLRSTTEYRKARVNRYHYTVALDDKQYDQVNK